MSLISEDNERFIQTGTTFYNCLQKLNCSINTFIQLLTSYLGCQVPCIIVNDSGTVRDYFEEVICSLRRVQGDMESSDRARTECCQFSKVTTAMTLEKDPCAKCPKTFCEAIKEISECAPLPLVLMLKNVSFFESMECALSQLMKSSIMSLRLTDLCCKKDPCELPGPAQPSKSCCIVPPPKICCPVQPPEICCSIQPPKICCPVQPPKICCPVQPPKICCPVPPICCPVQPPKICCTVQPPKICCPPCSPTDILEKLSSLVECQPCISPTLSATDYLQEIVKTMEPVADKLQQVTRAIEANMDCLKC